MKSKDTMIFPNTAREHLTSKFLFEISMIFETRGSIRKYWLTEDGIVWCISSLYHTTLDKPGH